MVLKGYGASSRANRIIERMLVGGSWTLKIWNALNEKYFDEGFESSLISGNDDHDRSNPRNGPPGQDH